MNLISVIVTTYNWPEALSTCLESLLTQNDKCFEVLIADDGSNDKTRKVIQPYLQQSIAIQHIWQEDRGFRAATARNKAVAASSGEYIIFVDGDCVLFPDFVANHRKLAEKGFFVPGNRALLSQTFTSDALQNTYLQLHEQSLGFFIKAFLTGKINRLTPFLRLPLGAIRKLQATKWQKAMTCNLAVWRDDFESVNGFDEIFQGWGYEDSDLVIRLIHFGVRRKEGRFALPVLHLWHKENDKTHHKDNFARLQQRIDEKKLISAKLGLDQYLPKPSDL